MAKQKSSEKSAEIQALVNERTVCEQKAKEYAEQRAAAERLARAEQKKIRELNERIAAAAIG